MGCGTTRPPRSALETVDITELRGYITRRSSDVWGMKDPRLVLTWPAWRRALDGHDVHLIPVLRTPQRVAASLTARDGVRDWDPLIEHYRTQLLANLEDHQ